MIPIDSKAVNSFNYPYLASLIEYYVDDRNNIIRISQET